MSSDARVAPTETRPLSVALVNDYEVIVSGLRKMLEPFSHKISLVTMAADHSAPTPVDIALYDSFAMDAQGWAVLDQLITDPKVAATVVYSSALPGQYVETVREHGAHGALAKRLSAAELVEHLYRIADGESIFENAPSATHASEDLWPGKSEGLTERQAEVLALICQGVRNDEIAARLYLSINTVKSYIRGAYRQIGVSSRSEAVLWGINHGLHSPR